MAELQWLDQPTEGGWWWLGSPGGNAFPVRVVNGTNGLYCGATPVKDMHGRWAPIPLVMVPAPPPPEPQPEIIDCQMVRVRRRDGDREAVVMFMTESAIHFQFLDDGTGWCSKEQVATHFHLPPGFQWPEKMLRL